MVEGPTDLIRLYQNNIKMLWPHVEQHFQTNKQEIKKIQIMYTLILIVMKNFLVKIRLLSRI